MSNATDGSDNCPIFTPVSPSSKTAIAVFFIIIMVISFVGNILVIVTVATNRRMRTVTNYLIINMAVADLLLTMFNMPSTIQSLIAPREYWYEGGFGEFLCKLLPFIQSVSVASSVLNMTAIATDRFFAIVIPLRRYVTFRVARVMMVAVWLVAIAVSAPTLYAMNLFPHPILPGRVLCGETWKVGDDEDTTAPKDFTIVLFLVFYAVPLLAMSALYSVVIYKLWIRKVPGQASQANQQRADKSKKKVLRMLLIVVILFALCWLPVHVTSFIYFFGSCSPPEAFRLAGYLLAQGSSAINPCVYVIFNENFRKGFARALCCCYHREGGRVGPGRATIGMDNTYIEGGAKSKSSHPTSPSPRMLRDTYT